MHDISAALEPANEANRMTGVDRKPPDATSEKPASLPATARRRSSRNGAARQPVITEFQPDAVEIEERAPPRVARMTLYCVVALIVAAVVWASVSRVDTIVTAQGKLIAISPNVVLQPLETSVVRNIHAKVGDLVRRGQPLATLDPTFSQADVDQLRTRVIALDANINRLNAELNGEDFTAADSKNPDEILQAKLFLQRRAYYQTSLRNYDAQIASAQANLKTNQNEEVMLLQRLETLRAIESMRGALMDKEVGSKLNFLLSRDARLDVDGSLSRLQGNQVDYTHRIEKARAEQQAFVEDFRRNAYQELVDTLAKRNSAGEDLKKAELRRQLIVLAAPVDAVVLEIASRTVGSVVREAETLFVLVPQDVKLQAEVNVDGKDIGQIAVGQSVRIKLDAFPFQKHGTGSGTVRIVSRDSFTPDPKAEPMQRMSAPYYRVLIDINNVPLRSLPAQFQMSPGMAVTAEMKVGNRSVISYFLYPLLRGLDESIREP
jgi:HlyD family secretion protein